MSSRLLKIRNRSSGCKCGRGNLKYLIVETDGESVIRASPPFGNLHRLAREWGTWEGCVAPSETGVIEQLTAKGLIKRNQVIVE